MIPMLDKSAASIEALREKWNLPFQQLRTPLTQYKVGGIPYGLDNGAFTDFNRVIWERMALAAYDDPLCKWVVMPDVVGNAEATTEMFWQYHAQGHTEKLAYVIQNGVTDEMIPWNFIDCIFVGGDNVFKDGQLARDICIEAKCNDYDVHVGRVNGPQRFSSWFDFADTCDGSGLAKYDASLERLVRIIKSYQNTKQLKLELLR